MAAPLLFGTDGSRYPDLDRVVTRAEFGFTMVRSPASISRSWVDANEWFCRGRLRCRMLRCTSGSEVSQMAAPRLFGTNGFSLRQTSIELVTRAEFRFTMVRSPASISRSWGRCEQVVLPMLGGTSGFASIPMAAPLLFGTNGFSLRQTSIEFVTRPEFGLRWSGRRRRSREVGWDANEWFCRCRMLGSTSGFAASQMAAPLLFATEGFVSRQTSIGLVKRFEFGIRIMRSAASIVV